MYIIGNAYVVFLSYPVQFHLPFPTVRAAMFDTINSLTTSKHSTVAPSVVIIVVMVHSSFTVHNVQHVLQQSSVVLLYVSVPYLVFLGARNAVFGSGRFLEGRVLTVPDFSSL